jgi:hypothetical protein
MGETPPRSRNDMSSLDTVFDTSNYIDNNNNIIITIIIIITTIILS